MNAERKMRNFYSVNDEEFEEVVGQPPGGMVRWGTSVFLFVLFLLVSISIFVQYADVLRGSFTLSSLNAPKSLVAGTDGKIQELFCKDGDVVQKGDILAHLESTASHEEVIRLKKELENLSKYILEERWDQVFGNHPISFRKLGELQGEYRDFILVYVQTLPYFERGMYTMKKQLLNSELKNLKDLDTALLAQEDVFIADRQIAKEDFRRKSLLYNQQVIPFLEYKQEESKYLNKQLPIGNIRISLINNKTAISSKQQELLQFEQQLAEEKSDFLQAVQTLLSQCETWSKKYLLTAPISGEVTWPYLLQQQQDVASGQEIFFITPSQTEYYGEVLLEQQNFGKIKLGQPVMISLTSFPYQEYGKLHGKVSFVSSIPNKEGKYFISVNLEKGLKTDLNAFITYRNKLSGTAEIVTSKKRLISRFFSVIKGVLNKPR